ncbi:transposable element Tcb1 transposase [Trichonephila clavipes]|nr:transposable element Tcb1 transposase [Trichonephila clavipes]
MAVMDRAATSRTIAQQIQSVTHHSMSARTIRRRLQQSRIFQRRLLLRLPLTGNHRHLRHYWCDERQTETTEWKNVFVDIVFTDIKWTLCLLTNPASACNITMVGFEFGHTVVRGC